MQIRKPHPKALQAAEILKREYARKNAADRISGSPGKLKNDEMLDILDENGNSINKLKRRSQVHRHGDWHRTVQVWIISSRNEVLMQKRAKGKLTYPDRWDISCAGHVESGSTSRLSAVREVKEELGLDLSLLELKKMGTVRHTYSEGDIQDNEIVDIFLVHRDISVHQCHLQKDEVTQVRFMQLRDLMHWAENNDDLLVPHPNEYRLVFKKLWEQKG